MNNATNNITSSSSSSHTATSSSHTAKGVANHTKTNIIYHGNKPYGKQRRVRPLRKEPPQSDTVKTESLWTKAVERTHAQVRNMQQTVRDVIVSAREYVFSVAKVSVRFAMCISGNEGIAVSVDSTLSRTVQLFKVQNGTVTRIDAASAAITGQLPNVIYLGNPQVSCEDGVYHLTYSVYPNNTTLYHLVIKNQTVFVAEYAAAQGVGVLPRPFRVAKLAGESGALGFPFGGTNDFHLLETNQTNQFSGQGQYLNDWSDSASFLPVRDGTLRIFQYASTQPSRDIPFNYILAGINHISNTTDYTTQNTPADPGKVGLATGGNYQRASLATYDTTTNTTSAKRVLPGDPVQPKPSIAPYGSGIWVSVRQLSNPVNGTNDIAYDFVDESMNSIIGGERTYPVNSYVDTQPQVGVGSNGTVIMAFSDENSMLCLVHLDLVEPTTPSPSVDEPSPSLEQPSPALAQPSPPVALPSPPVVPPPQPVEQPSSPPVVPPSPPYDVQVSPPVSISIKPPSILITPPANLNQTLVPVTPEVIVIDGVDIQNLTITDKSGWRWVFNGNCSDVPECDFLSPEDFFNTSWALGNGTLKKVPVVQACTIQICVQSHPDTRVDQLFRVDDNKKYTTIYIVVGTIAFVITMVGLTIVGIKVVKPIMDNHRARNKPRADSDETIEMDQRVQEHKNEISVKPLSEHEKKRANGDYDD